MGLHKWYCTKTEASAQFQSLWQKLFLVPARLGIGWGTKTGRKSISRSATSPTYKKRDNGARNLRLITDLLTAGANRGVGSLTTSGVHYCRKRYGYRQRYKLDRALPYPLRYDTYPQPPSEKKNPRWRERAMKNRHAQARALRQSGLTYTEIGRRLGVSRQRAYQMGWLPLPYTCLCVRCGHTWKSLHQRPGLCPECRSTAYDRRENMKTGRKKTGKSWCGQEGCHHGRQCKACNAAYMRDYRKRQSV